MSIHLLVVGEHKKPDSEMEYVARVVQSSNGHVKLRRCTSPRELVRTVRSAVLEHRQPIETLDIFDHGRSGVQTIADEVLWDHMGKGDEIARALKLYLTHDAHVRLLGCVTSDGDKGWELLRKLDEAFGGCIVVHGTIKIVKHRHFDARGFKPEHDEEFLYSSTQARTKRPPTETERIEQLSSWMREVEQAHDVRIEGSSLQKFRPRPTHDAMRG